MYRFALLQDLYSGDVTTKCTCGRHVKCFKSGADIPHVKTPSSTDSTYVHAAKPGCSADTHDSDIRDSESSSPLLRSTRCSSLSNKAVYLPVKRVCSTVSDSDSDNFCHDQKLVPGNLLVDFADETVSDSDATDIADAAAKAQDREISIAAVAACHSQARPALVDSDSDGDQGAPTKAVSPMPKKSKDKLCHTAASPLVKRKKSSPVKLLTQSLSQFVTDADALALSGPCSGRVPKHNFVKCKRNSTSGLATRIPSQFQPDYDQHGRAERAKEAAWVAEHGPRKPLRSKFSKPKPVEIVRKGVKRPAHKQASAGKAKKPKK